VNVWLWGATALLVLLVPLGAYAAFATSRLDALVALEAGGAIFTLALVLLAEGFRRTAYTTLGLVAAVVTFAGSLVFVRFFERELEP
jgi:multisubunit Na+/H+ antiporter MnhF subunit